MHDYKNTALQKRTNRKVTDSTPCSDYLDFSEFARSLPWLIWSSIRTSNRKLTASTPCSEFFSELTQVRIGDILLSKLLSIIKGSQKNPNSTLAVQLLVSSLNCSGRHFGSCYTRKGKKFKMSEIFKNMI